MKKTLIRVLSLLLILISTVILSGTTHASSGYSEYLKSNIPTGYYDSVDLSKDKDTIADTLEDIMNPSDYVRIPYGSKITALLTETDPVLGQPGKATGFYSGQALTSYNKEHVWAKSHGFGKNSGSNPYCDIHHLRPTINAINSSRSHWFFDEGGVPDGYGNNIVKNISFEPRDEVKGDVARIVFYMATRYKTEYGLHIVDDLGDTNSTDPTMGQLSTLLKWNYSDPVSESEIHRNEAIFGIQHNRNVYIDHPEYVDYVYPNEYSNTFDQANVDNVESLITNLPSVVTLNDKDAIDLANNSYNALSRKEKEAITNYSVLVSKTAELNVLIEAAKPDYEKLINIHTKNSLSLTYIEAKNKFSVKKATYNLVVDELSPSIEKLFESGSKLSYVFLEGDTLPSVDSYSSIQSYINSNKNLTDLNVTSSDITENGSNYTVTKGISFNDADGLKLRNFNKELTSALIFEHNGQLYQTAPRTSSVKDLVRTYLTDYKDNNVVKGHFGLLNHVKDIKIPVSEEEMNQSLVNPFKTTYLDSADVTLNTLVKDTEVTYKSSSSSIVITDGKASIKTVTEPETVTVTASYKSGNKTFTKDFTVQLKVAGAYNTFEEFNAGTDGTVFTLEGIVTSIDDQWSSQYKNMSVTVKVDGSTTIFYHCTISKEASSLIKVGSTVVVTGEKFTYKTTEEIKNGTFINVDGKDLTDNTNPVDPTGPANPTDPVTPTGDALSLVTINGNTASYSGIHGDITVTKGQNYDQAYELGLYLLVFQEFPPNYYTKSQINKHIGEDMATVGGDLFKNLEQELPLEQTYFESDVDNWEALRDHGTGSRGMKRVVVTQDFTHAYYTSTHYGDFTEILFNV